jgi:hypothetical protein
MNDENRKRKIEEELLWDHAEELMLNALCEGDHEQDGIDVLLAKLAVESQLDDSMGWLSSWKSSSEPREIQKPAPSRWETGGRSF